MHELFTELSPGLVIFWCLNAIFLGYLFVWMRALANFCRDAVKFVENQNKNAVSLRRITELDVAVTELTDAYEAMYQSNKKLRSRIGMRKVRSDRKNGLDSSGAPPADEAGRAAYKGELRNKLKAEGRL